LQLCFFDENPVYGNGILRILQTLYDSLVV